SIVYKPTLIRTKMRQNIPVNWIASAAQRTTTSQGGVCHMNSNKNVAAAITKSVPLLIPAVQTGL
ncbi:MAG: hypothetical protein ACXW6J_28095, partial [Candidatus Binatia bacterium]